MSNDSDPILIYATYPDAAIAADHVRRLCDARLIACGNILAPHRSIYRWQGAVEDTTETAALMKTIVKHQQTVMDWIVSHHPYDTPCVCVIAIAALHPAFHAWLAAETAGDPSHIDEGSAGGGTSSLKG